MPPAPGLAADLEVSLHRLKLDTMHALTRKLLVTSETQRRPYVEYLRTLTEAEIAAPDASSARAWPDGAALLVRKTLDEFGVAPSSVPRVAFDHLTSLEWVRAAENPCLVGPVGTGKSHLLIGLGHAAT